MGWFTVVAYFVTFVLAVLVVRRKCSNQRLFWQVLTVFLFLLAVNKQLDLQSALTAVGRCMAELQGWYENRRSVQIGFILTIAIFGVIGTGVLAWNMRRGMARIWLAFYGFAFLVGFVVIRAAGFHNFDRLIAFEVGVFRLNWVFELTGIASIAINAVSLLKQGPEVARERRQRRRRRLRMPYTRQHSVDRHSSG